MDKFERSFVTMSKNKQNGNRKISIPNDAKDFAKITFKKYKKHNEDYYDSKKELKQSYFSYLFELLPETINFIVKYGYIKDDEVKETKDAIFAKLCDEDFVKKLTKEIKNDNKPDNIKLLPIVIKEILVTTDKTNTEMLAKDPSAKIFDMTDLVELSQLIMKKKMKKMAKAEIDIKLAFDVLSVIPTEEALKSSSNYRIHILYDVLYEHAKVREIPFKKIMDIIIDPEWYPVFILFALLERKEKFGYLTDSQKQFYVAITSWCFDTLENLPKEDIENVLNKFVEARKRDEANGKDANRRYALASLSESEYPRIVKTINKMIANNDSIKKYF